MDNNSQQSSARTSSGSTASTNDSKSIHEQNLIRTCIEKHFDRECFVKFQRILEYLGEVIYEPLFASYNANLLNQFQQASSYIPFLPGDYTVQQHMTLKVKFYSFRFMANIGAFLLEKIANDEPESENHFISLTKILLFHGLTTRSDTANFALVELEQLCHKRHMTLQDLYRKHSYKFLRLIIKAILHKLIKIPTVVNGNGNDSNSSDCQLGGANRIMYYMTRAFEVFNIGTISSEDVAQSLIIVTNFLHKELYTDATRQYIANLASYQKIDMFTLLRSHIQTILVSLLLQRKLSHLDINSLLGKLSSFCERPVSDLLANKFTFMKSRLLLQYSVDPKTVKDGIYYLSKFEKEEHEQPFEDEFDEEKHFIDYLNPSMVGILLGIDAYFTSSKINIESDDHIKHISSLLRVLQIMDDSQIQAIHVKLLSTLSLLLNRRSRRNNQELNLVLIDLWNTFVSKLNPDLKSSLMINICVALCDMTEDCPRETAPIYDKLIFAKDTKDHTDKLKCLFFIPCAPSFERIYAQLSEFVQRNDQISDLREMDLAMDGVISLMKLENQKARLIALKKTKELLRVNQVFLTNRMLANLDEPINLIVSKLIESLFAMSSCQDDECSPLIADCLGILGAVNPVRLDHLIYGDMHRAQKFDGVLKLEDPRFISHIIERLSGSLFSDQQSESETASYGLQVIVKRYNIFENAALKKVLSDDAIKACDMCRKTSYSGTKKFRIDTSTTIYAKLKLENVYCFREWIDRFSTHLISTINSETLRPVLLACSYVFKYNLKLAEYILVNVIVHIILYQDAQASLIKQEMMAILEEDVSLATQDIEIAFNDDLRASVESLHIQCANIIFCALDTLQRIDYLTRELANPTGLQYKHVKPLRDFLLAVPKDKLAILASRCRSHARALCYFEQYLDTNKDQFDKYATTLQKIYVALDDTYEATGVEIVKKDKTRIMDDIVNYVACGQFDKAFICCATSLPSAKDESEKEMLIEESLRNLSDQGDQLRLFERSKQLYRDYSIFRRSIIPHAIEATWKLHKWDELQHTIENDHIDSLLEEPSVCQGLLINSHLHHRDKIPNQLCIVRRNLLKPLSLALKDRSAYFRGYKNLLNLHAIEDYDLFCQVLNDFPTCPSISSQASDYGSQRMNGSRNVEIDAIEFADKLDRLYEIWSKRVMLVQPALMSVEPLLEWQRTLCSAVVKEYTPMRNKVQKDLGKMWLKSAELTRDAHSLDRSFNCLIQARRCFGEDFRSLSLDLRVKYLIEQAKLLWEQGDKMKAIRALSTYLDNMRDHSLFEHLKVRRDKDSATKDLDPFPDLKNLIICEECSKYDQTELKSFARLKILLTQYTEEAAAGIPETLFYMYEECVHLGVDQEETHFRLARYYERLLSYYQENPQFCERRDDDRILTDDSTQRFSQSLISGNVEDVYTKLMEHSIIAFGRSLMFGVKHLKEAMPRLLNTWYDLGSKKTKQQTGLSRNVSSRIENTIRFIDTLVKSIPCYYFLPAISILLSRVSHPHSGVSKKTCDILYSLLQHYPHQITWQMIALLNDNQNEDRKKAARTILLNSKNKGTPIEKVISHTIAFSKILMELCKSYGGDVKKKPSHGIQNIKDISPNALKFDFSRAQVMVPIEDSIRAILPYDSLPNDGLDKHVAFPQQNTWIITKIEPKVRVFNSVQKPRQITLRCQNGKDMSIICKNGDDLRKDSRCTEFLNLLNRILKRNSQSNARFFEIQTFLVLPLDQASGLIEMVPNVATMRSIVDRLYKEEKGPNFSIQEQLARKDRTPAPAVQYELFKNTVLPKVSPPVLHLWFMRRYTEPTSWYMARLAYTRTVAVSSMGGYIIGLGDRHLDNVLIDTNEGRVVHVDFNLLFHQGETLPVAERVPFRLTHNMVAAMGSMGTEGNFRRVCEITMRVMRKEKEALLTTLKPFMHDPCSEWFKIRDRGSRLDQEENKSAKYRIEVVERKLKGFPRSRKFKPLTLIDSYSVEAQVDNLIQEATDNYNLAQMYFGWCPHI